jgi:hypothetical protein
MVMQVSRVSFGIKTSQSNLTYDEPRLHDPATTRDLLV